MNDSLLMLQLVFNLVMLVAIILLSRSPSAAPARPVAAKSANAAEPPKPTRRKGRRERRAAKRARAEEQALPPHLAALLSSTEQTELVAEQMLRERLARLEHAAESGR